MKKILAMLVAISLLLTMAVVPGGLSAFAGDDDIVYFPDDVLKFQLKFVGVDTNGDGEITQGELAKVTDLSIWGQAHLMSLEGLQYAVNLKKLWIDDGTFKDLSPLSGLTQLTSLGLSWNWIEDISPLSGLTNLTNLELGDNQITDISPLANLTGLTTLTLFSNKIEDISALSNLQTLESLEIYNNRISDLTPLSNLTSLKTLDINNNYLAASERDLTDLGSENTAVIKALKKNGCDINIGTQKTFNLSPKVNFPDPFLRLYFVYNGPSQLDMEAITSLDFYDALESRVRDEAWRNTNHYTFTPEEIALFEEFASINRNIYYGRAYAELLKEKGLGIQSLEGLQYAINLKELKLYGSGVEDLSPLAGLKGLERLDLRNSFVSDLSPLKGLSKLTVLDLDENLISNISALSSLVNLQGLYLNNNNISDISALSNLKQLSILMLFSNQISDISPLKELVKLRLLELSNNNIEDISALSKLTQLVNLGLGNNQIGDITALQGLNKLEVLGLSNNRIVDISAISKLTKLVILYLENNNITDISPLLKLSNLFYADTENNSENKITDISTISGVSSLSELYAINPEMSALPHISDLFYVNMKGNYLDTSNADIANLIKQIDTHVYENGTGYIDYDLQKDLPFTRQSGSTRIETAINIAQTGWSEGAETVILTSGKGFADALAGGSLSAALDVPLLLTANPETGLEDDVLQAIKDLKANNVVILGGTGTVSTDIEEELEAQGLDVERRSGGNRYETAVDIATALYENAEFDTVFLADGNNYPDALAGAPVSGILGQPILFTNSKDKNVREETLTFIEENGIKNVVILGGSSSVSDEVKKALEDKNIEVSRISGGNRYETALNIYNEYKDIFTGDAITLTTGTNFPDALAGSAYSAKIGAPLFLLSDTLNSANIRTAITDSGRSEILVYGGSGSLSDAAVLKHIL
ncbi:MAG: cell wall-binding repeat-containing protein [Oscillospiraceae bacterium]|nr:cell wall-binding repeat-containing protein [Oscillospiraceae bacterium]